MKDKERILMLLADQLASTLILRKDSHYQAGAYDDGSGGEYVHFVDRDPKPGDLVLVTHTRGQFDFTVSWFVSGGAHDGIVREIGSKRQCRVTNVSFRVIVGINRDDLLERHERAMFEKVHAVGNRIARGYVHVLSECRIEGRKATVSWRKRWGRENAGTTVIEWTPRMSRKAIRAALAAAGCGVEEGGTDGHS